MTFIVVGICIGVVLTAGRVPKVRWAPLAVAIVLLLLAVFGFREMKPISLSEAFLLLISAVLAATLYAGALWDRQKLDPQVNAWGWAWREFTNPGYARALHRERLSPPTPGDARQSPESL